MALLFCVALLSLGAILAIGALDRLRSRPLDGAEVRQRLGLEVPGPVRSLVKRDGIAYPVHMALGGIILATGGDPAAAGVQWFKAAAHARSAEEVVTTASRLAESRTQSRDPTAFDQVICAHVEGGFWTGYQREVTQAAGVGCPRRPHRS